jgi:hypothetical protein
VLFSSPSLCDIGELRRPDFMQSISTKWRQQKNSKKNITASCALSLYIYGPILTRASSLCVDKEMYLIPIRDVDVS